MRRFVADEVGQNLIETALIIGVVSLVLVLGFMNTGVLGAVQDVGKSVVCEAQGGTWTAGTKGTAGTCS
ncbi:MAG: hypothetical protein U0360_00505 [Dehalococcoidia bacterium]